MDLVRVVEVLTSSPYEVPTSIGGTRFVGNGLLRCGVCDRTVLAENRRQGWAPAPYSATYTCEDFRCTAVRASVGPVDRQLQAFTVQQLSRPAFVKRWRRTRLAELDAEIAEAHEVRQYCRDPRYRAEVARQLGGRPRGLRRRIDEHDLSWRLRMLAQQTVRLVTERATLAATLGHGPTLHATARLGMLKTVQSELGMLSWSTSLEVRFGPRVARMLGAGRSRAAARARLEDLLWALLSETDWRDAVAGPAPVDDDALALDWYESPNTMVGRRHAALSAAAKWTRLVLEPTTQTDAVLQMVPAEERRRERPERAD